MDTASRDFPPGNLRVSDADRERAVQELSEAFQVGRITADELDERSGQALRARSGNELTALLEDLPVERTPAEPGGEPAPAERATALDRSRRLFATRTAFAAGVAAICCSALALANGLNTGPSLQQRELARDLLARQGLSVPIPPAPGFDWAGTLTPAAIAVLLVALIICLRVRVTRADGP
ncbi:MAG TPA: DUF1707 domain-containing protein [Streptosporangiaceae bacterium]|nr:DUF1707 domain-containing protein [Streptosporangiaceae bacterium]